MCHLWIKICEIKTIANKKDSPLNNKDYTKKENVNNHENI